MKNKALLKIVCLSSLIIGFIAGIFTLIPPLISLAFLFIIIFSAPFVIIYLYKLDLINGLEMPQYLTIGAISGFFSSLGFLAIYFPLAFILNLIFKIDLYMWIKVIFSNLEFLFPMIFLIAILCALINMFSAFITVCLHYYFLSKE